MSEISVTIGPDLIERERKDQFGEEEFAALEAALIDEVERALDKKGRYAPAAEGMRLELILVDAKASRPTPRQLYGRVGIRTEGTPGFATELGFSSGTGGAEIHAHLTDASGANLGEMVYIRFETGANVAIASRTWGHAEDVFKRFGKGLAKRLDKAERAGA
ncbi:MAG: hypothetical protein ACFB2Z_01965 [Maricaulaceae bacterium]